MTQAGWRIRLGGEAEKDFVRILKYTNDTFGERQAENYKALLIDALVALEVGPNVPGSAARDEIQPGLRTIHVARRGRRGRLRRRPSNPRAIGGRNRPTLKNCRAQDRRWRVFPKKEGKGHRQTENGSSARIHGPSSAL